MEPNLDKNLGKLVAEERWSQTEVRLYYNLLYLILAIKTSEVAVLFVDHKSQSSLFFQLGFIVTIVILCRHFHREPKHYVSSKKKCAVIYLHVLWCLFESFKRNLNEAKAVYISEYYWLAFHFVIITLRLRIKFLLSLLTINSHRGERFSGFITPRI